MFSPFKIFGIATSSKEIFDLLKAWLAIAFAFAILGTGAKFGNNFYGVLLVTLLTVGLGFLLHELGHKLVAQRYGCLAEFRSYDTGLVLAIAMSFAGIILASPGAVMIYGRINARKNGIISAAGPLVNLALAVFFVIMGIAAGNLGNKFVSYGISINSWLALFNLIPYGPFDGKKIIDWSKRNYFILLALCIAMYVVSIIL